MLPLHHPGKSAGARIRTWIFLFAEEVTLHTSHLVNRLLAYHTSVSFVPTDALESSPSPFQGLALPFKLRGRERLVCCYAKGTGAACILHGRSHVPHSLKDGCL